VADLAGGAHASVRWFLGYRVHGDPAESVELVLYRAPHRLAYRRARARVSLT
jgi:hypothetical protein